MAAGWVQFRSYNDLSKALFGPDLPSSSKAPQEIEAEMLRVVEAYERKGR